jgi:hypothetical protein
MSRLECSDGLGAEAHCLLAHWPLCRSWMSSGMKPNVPSPEVFFGSKRGNSIERFVTLCKQLAWLLLCRPWYLQPIASQSEIWTKRFKVRSNVMAMYEDMSVHVHIRSIETEDSRSHLQDLNMEPRKRTLPGSYVAVAKYRLRRLRSS